jgi:hypothetical protein
MSPEVVAGALCVVLIVGAQIAVAVSWSRTYDKATPEERERMYRQHRRNRWP